VLAKHKAEIEETGTRVAGEDWDTFEQAWDTGRLFTRNESLSVPAPTTVDPSSVEEVAAATDLSYPVLVKARSKISWDESGGYHRIDTARHRRNAGQQSVPCRVIAPVQSVSARQQRPSPPDSRRWRRR